MFILCQIIIKIMQKSIQESDELTPSQELSVMNDKTSWNGLTEVSLNRWEKKDDKTVRVWFWTPTGEEVYEDMKWPKAGRDISKYKFVKLLHDVGLSLDMSDFDHADDATAKKNDSGWTLKVPDYDYHEICDANKKEIIKHRIYEVFDIYNERASKVEGSEPGSITNFICLIIFSPFMIAFAINDLSEEYSEGAELYLGGIITGIIFGVILAVVLLGVF